jgi:hypothetical protein
VAPDRRASPEKPEVERAEKKGDADISCETLKGPGLAPEEEEVHTDHYCDHY